MGFLVYCIKFACHENICFLMEVVLFEKNIYPRQVLILEIQRLVERFVERGAAMEINISSRAKHMFLEKYHAPESPSGSKYRHDIFSSMKVQIEQMIALEIVPKYAGCSDAGPWFL